MHIKKSFFEFYKEYFIESLKWKVSIMLFLLMGNAIYYWPIDAANYRGTGVSVWKILFVVFSIPFIEGLVQGLYACYLQEYTDYFEKQEIYRIAALKSNAERAIKRAEYGRWWWLKRRKK